MKLSEMFPSRFLTGEDLGGRVWPLTVARVAAESVTRQGKPEIVHVVYFQGAKKGLVLCKTTARQMAEVAGADDTDRWPGVKVALYAEAVKVGGVERVGVRVRAVAPEPTTATGQGVAA